MQQIGLLWNTRTSEIIVEGLDDHIIEQLWAAFHVGETRAHILVGAFKLENKTIVKRFVVCIMK